MHDETLFLYGRMRVLCGGGGPLTSTQGNHTVPLGESVSLLAIICESRGETAHKTQCMASGRKRGLHQRKTEVWGDKVDGLKM